MYWREQAKAGKAGLRPDHQDNLRQGHLREPRPDELRRRQGRNRRVHEDRGPRGRPLRRHRHAVAPVALTCMTKGPGPAPRPTRSSTPAPTVLPVVTRLASDEAGGVADVSSRPRAESSRSAEGWHRARRRARSRTRPSRRPRGGAPGKAARTPAWSQAAPEPRPALTGQGRPAMPLNPDAVGTTGDPVECSGRARTPALRRRHRGRRRRGPFTTENTTGVTQRCSRCSRSSSPAGRGSAMRTSARSTRRCSCTASRPSRCTAPGRGHGDAHPNATDMYDKGKAAVVVTETRR